MGGPQVPPLLQPRPAEPGDRRLRHHPAGDAPQAQLPPGAPAPKNLLFVSTAPAKLAGAYIEKPFWTQSYKYNIRLVDTTRSGS
jgi:hypothetical protein